MVLRGGGQPAFDEHAVSFARQVMPTLMRVAHLRSRVGALRLTGEADAYDALSVGFIVVDGDSNILLSNGTGEKFLSGMQYGLDATKGALRARSTPEGAKLHDIIARACTDFGGILGPGGDMVISDQSTGLPSASLSAAPMRDASAFGLPVGRAAVVFLQDLASRLPPRFEEKVQAMFGLTRKEAALAASRG
jgi:hypothetical protein